MACINDNIFIKQGNIGAISAHRREIVRYAARRGMYSSAARSGRRRL